MVLGLSAAPPIHLAAGPDGAAQASRLWLRRSAHGKACRSCCSLPHSLPAQQPTRWCAPPPRPGSVPCVILWTHTKTLRVAARLCCGAIAAVLGPADGNGAADGGARAGGHAVGAACRAMDHEHAGCPPANPPPQHTHTHARTRTHTRTRTCTLPLPERLLGLCTPAWITHCSHSLQWQEGKYGA